MFFQSLRVVQVFAIAFAVLAAACALIWFVRKRHKLVQLSVVVLCTPIALLAALFIGLQVLTSGCESYSGPLYSPDHTKLIRVSSLDGGALGGSSALELLAHRGFSSTYIYRGGWHSVDVQKDVRWLDNEHVTVEYEPYQFLDCTSTRTVQVHCSEKIPPAPTGTLRSPDGDAVAELHTAKDGTYEGTDAVILTGKVGYAFIYVGSPASVVWSQTRWLTAHTLLITTKAKPRACSDQIGITVVCVPYSEK